MRELRVDGWTPVGETANTLYYTVQARVLAAVPRPGCSDDAETARENMRFQNEHFRQAGHSGVVAVFFDRMVSQDAGARRIYQTEADLQHVLGTALVGGSLLSRAMGAFFMGLNKPAIPVKMFASLEDAIHWGERLMLARDAGAS